MRGVLNAGCRRGATVPRCVPKGKTIEIEEFAIFCPKALGGIGEIPDTIADRAIRIELRRKRPGDSTERFRVRYVEPQAVLIRDALEAWSEPGVRDLTGAEPVLPDELHDRAQDSWEPLLAIADLAGADWPVRARDAAVTLTPSDVEDDSIAVQLLADVRTVFDDAGSRLFTADLLERLVELDSRPWGDWSKGKPITARKVAGLLRPFDVHPVDIRIGNTVKKGYHAESFADAWSRYLHTPGENALQSNSAGQTTCSASGSGSDPQQSNSAGHTLFTADSGETPQRSDQGRSVVAHETSPERGNGTKPAPIEVVEDEADWQPCIRCGRPCPSRIDGRWQHVRCDVTSTHGAEVF